MPTTNHDDMAGMNHDAPAATSSANGSMNGMDDMKDMQGSHDMSSMSGMSGTSTMQGGSPPPGARDPDAYAEGQDFGPIPRPRMADEHSFGSLLVNRLETVRTTDTNSATYDVQGWYGRDYDRATLKGEGDIDRRHLQTARTELLWSHAFASYWDSQLGIRHDNGSGPDRNWLAVGVQGLAPYWFDVEATAYVGPAGRSALRLSAEYELLITQRLILQPRLEGRLYGRDDPERGIGNGLSDVVAGMRLRYEITRQFAPYLGVEWAGTFGDTRRLARDAGERTSETRLVAGLRVWF
ncbi:MAG: copper resistance protein B [Betaproteobacteria bacterium]|nr:copper resistance protein B [Betaproteobacteria bacterium]